MFKLKFIIIIFISIFILFIIDLYPLFRDYELRYLLKKSSFHVPKLKYDFFKLDKIMYNNQDFEGHIGCSKYKINFIINILNNYNIKTIAEIGFNGGHSAALFLNCKKIYKLRSFDLCNHKYSKKSILYIKNKFKNRFYISCGNSLNTVPQYIGDKFDMVFIDGGHYNNIPYLDTINTIKYLLKPNGYILMDDTFYSYIVNFMKKNNVNKTWKFFIKHNIIKQIDSIRGLSFGKLI